MARRDFFHELFEFSLCLVKYIFTNSIYGIHILTRDSDVVTCDSLIVEVINLIDFTEQNFSVVRYFLQLNLLALEAEPPLASQNSRSALISVTFTLQHSKSFSE